MVDALRAAGTWVRQPSGRIIDLRPASVIAHVEIGLPDGTRLTSGSLAVDEQRRQRHRDADRALRQTVEDGTFAVAAEEEFSFYRYPESLDELREYIATKWRQTRLDDATYSRSIELQRTFPEGRLWLREQVAIRILHRRPTSAPEH